MSNCRVIKSRGNFVGKQGFSYAEGISKESCGSRAICMHMLEIPPGGRAKAHLHEHHETAIFVIEGCAVMYFGDRLQNRVVAAAGDYVYIPAGVPHLPFNPSTEVVRAIIARTDPNEQESVILRPDLDELAATFEFQAWK